MSLEKFINEIKSLGFPTNSVLNFLRILYTARELPYERVIKLSQIPYPTEPLFEVEDRWIIKLLREYDIILSGLSETTIYGELANIRYYRLTEKGFELGSQVFQGHLRDIIGKLVDLLNRYSRKLIRIIALSAIDPRTGGATWLAIKVDGMNLENTFFVAALEFEMLMVSPEELVRAYRDSERAYGNLRLVLERVGKARVRMYEPSVYDMFISRFLVRYNGRVHEEALKLMEELSALGLAIKVPVYSSKGEYIGDEYRAPPEVVYVLEEYSADVDLSEARKSFLAAELMSRALVGRLAKRELLEALGRLGISEDEVKITLEVMYGEGLTSRYNEAGDPESPAFIILDEARVKGEIKRLINLVESTVL